MKNKAPNGKCNIAGQKIAKLRTAIRPTVSQRALADRLQLLGIDLDKNAIQLMECGKRIITDIELVALAKALQTTPEELLKGVEDAPK